MNFYNKVRYLCEQQGFSISNIAYKIPNLEITRGSISGWKKGSMPRTEKVNAIANYFGVTVEFLTDDTKDFAEINLESNDITEFKEVGIVTAGYGKEPIEYDTGEITLIPTAMLKGRKKDEFFLLRVKGSSMFPTFCEGDKILIERCSSVDNGTFAVVLYGQEATVKKVYYTDDYIDLIPSNPEYQTKRISGNELSECKVLGKVVNLIREF